MLGGFVLDNTYLTIFGLVVCGALGTTLLCENCKRMYLQRPLSFLISGDGTGICVKCGHNNQAAPIDGSKH